MEEEFDIKINALVTHWEKNGLEINSGVLDKDIESLENILNFKLDQVFIGYLKRINGMKDFECDGKWFSFWPINRLLSEYAYDHPNDLICFSDYSINLCSFGFNKNDNKVYTHFQGSDELIFISDTFVDFIDIYLNEPNVLIN